MADMKISERPLAAEFNGTEEMIVNQDGVTRRSPLGTVRTRHPGYLPGKSYDIYGGILAAGSGITPTTDILYLFPFIAQSNKTPLVGVSLRTTGAGGTGSAFKAALWNIDPNVGQPRGLPVVASNAGAATITNALCTALYTAPLTPVVGKMYAVGFVVAAATPIAPCFGFSSNSLLFCSLSGEPPGATAGAMVQCWTIAQPYANDIAACNIVGGLAATTGAQPIMWHKT